MENESFRLIVRRGPRPNEVYELTGEITNLGRDITNDIVINDREASRHHLRFTRGADGYTIEDLGSTNGTFINGKRLTGATSLKNGDMVGLGETVTLQFEAGRPGSSSPEPAPQASPAPVSAPQDSADAAYRPPAQAPSQPSPAPQPAVQQPAPYSAPQPAQQYVPPQSSQPPYQQADDYAPPQDYYNQQGSNAPAASYGPPPPGYDYDPYAIRDDEGSNTNQWLLIGCLGLLLLCCCLTVVAAVAIDSFCLYESVPILNNILEALSVPVNCP